MNEKKHYLTLQISSIYCLKTNLPCFLTCLLCFTQLVDSECNTSFMALCLIANAAISQDVTVSMCQEVAVMEGVGDG